MKLAQPFIQLPLIIDADRLAEEVAAIPQSAWQAHPTGFRGNSAVPLISVGGEPNDKIKGAMAPTEHLLASEYMQQVLAGFNVVFGRSRLMALGPGAEVPLHCDSNYHWFTRVRIHIPVITYPEVEFHCEDEMINMAAGEAWIFDNWRMHRVLNPTDKPRVHLVADTVGSAGFWAMVEQSLAAQESQRQQDFTALPYTEGERPVIETEQYNNPQVMAPAELDLLCRDLLDDLSSSLNGAAAFRHLVTTLIHEWRRLWVRFGPSEQAMGNFEQLRNRTIKALANLRQPLPLTSNGRPAQNVLLARVLIACVDRPIPGMKTL